MTMDTELADRIRALEMRLLDPELRSDRAALDAALSDDFLEFGKSGRTFDKGRIMEELASEPPLEATMHDFEARLLGPDVVLATYVARIIEDGAMTQSLRSSIWVRRDGRWQVTFHQGTPTN